MSLVEKGDPYPRHIEGNNTTGRERARRSFRIGRRRICCAFRAKWVRRNGWSHRLSGTLERFGHEGVKEMLVVPISFVTEHIETSARN